MADVEWPTNIVLHRSQHRLNNQHCSRFYLNHNYFRIIIKIFNESIAINWTPLWLLSRDYPGIGILADAQFQLSDPSSLSKTNDILKSISLKVNHPERIKVQELIQKNLC